jgi:hypothetical protein
MLPCTSNPSVWMVSLIRYPANDGNILDAHENQLGKAGVRTRGNKAGLGEGMAHSFRRVLLVIPLVLLGSVQSGQAQQANSGTKVVQVTGLTDVKNKTGGVLVVDNGALHFTYGQRKVDVPASAVEDVVTGNDSQRLVHGTLGTLTMFGPYGSGRFLSLFRTKLDTLTIKYRDTDGALHGAIFTMAVGKAESLKKDLLAQGAHSSVPMEDAAAPSSKDQKP